MRSFTTSIGVYATDANDCAMTPLATYENVGDSVKGAAADLNGGGKRVSAASRNASTARFAASYPPKYAALAKGMPATTAPKPR